MAKEFECSWEDITNLNIITFNHRLKFVEHKMKQIEKSRK